MLLYLNHIYLTITGSDIYTPTLKLVPYMYDEMLKCVYFSVLIRRNSGMP